MNDDPKQNNLFFLYSQVMKFANVKNREKQCFCCLKILLDGLDWKAAGYSKVTLFHVSV